MSFSIHFEPRGMSTAKYDEVIKKLEAAGAGHPEGRLYHVCFGDTANLHVTDVWESMESFEAFGKVLMPILGSLGVDAGQPQISKVHNVIEQ